MTKKIIFMGTPQFAAEVLQGLLSTEYEVIAVVTQPDRPVGRKRVLTPPPVKVLAVEHGIEVYQPEKISKSPEMTALIELEADLIVTAAYGQYVPTTLLNAPRYSAINVHASLLPKYRGGAPIHYAIWQGEEETGISIMYMTREMDAGDILAQRTIPIEKTDDVGGMFVKLAEVGRDLLLDTLPKLFNHEIEAQPQDSSQVTYSPTISKEQEQLNWEQTAQQIDYHVRGFRPFPSVYTWMNDQRVKVWQGVPFNEEKLSQTNTAAKAGTIVAVEDESLIVQCGKGTFYAIQEWQESGKKRMLIADFLKGNSPETMIGQQFEIK